MAYKSFLEFAKHRKTTYEFSPRNVRKGDILKILEAARFAPSFSNVQPWRFIVVRDKETIGKLMRTAAYGSFHTSPPAIIALILTGRDYSDNVYRGAKHGMLGAYDAYMSIAMPALIMVFAAQDLGISSSIRPGHPGQCGQILGMGKGDTVALLLGLGYESKPHAPVYKKRKPLREIVSYR